MAILIEGILSATFGVDYVQLHASYVDKSVYLLGFYLPYIYLIGFGLAVVLLAALYCMLYRTKFGRAVRASLQNRTRRRPDRHQRQPHAHDLGRDRRRGHGGRRNGVRRDERVQPRQSATT